MGFKFKLLSCVGLLALVAVICVSQVIRAEAASVNVGIRNTAATKRIKVAITGMDCKGCESGISGELLRTPGVIAASVSYERQEAVVDYDPAKITPAGIIAAIKGAGFGARLRRG